jgi:hypothetical protein
MSAFIGSVNGPRHNSPHAAAEVWCSLSGVELFLVRTRVASELPSEEEIEKTRRSFDPIAARNLAALLVRGADEAERMRARDRGLVELEDPAPDEEFDTILDNLLSRVETLEEFRLEVAELMMKHGWIQDPAPDEENPLR